MIIPFILIIVGFASLIYGANWLVNGASSLAKKHNVSDLIIGLTIVSFGTSAPELVVNSLASYDGFSDIVFGNIIGSNNFNLFIVLGVTALVYPIAVQPSTAWKEIPISLFVTILLFAFANNFFANQNTDISRADGAIMLLAFLFFLYYLFLQVKKSKPEVIDYEPMSNFKIWGLIIIGLGGLILGGKLVVDNGVDIATQLGVSQKVIGLTIIAAGTSLPELVTSVVAAVKKNSDIAIGNIVGSNIFNILFILPVSALIHPIEYNTGFNQDLLILIGGTAFLIIAMVLGKKKRIDRWEAVILLGFYLFYSVRMVIQEL